MTTYPDIGIALYVLSVCRSQRDCPEPMLRAIAGGGIVYFCWIGGQTFQKLVYSCRLLLVLRIFAVYDIVGGVVTFEKSRGVLD